ncbi:MAG: hypothetical protein H6727_07580 [Myxococcales bacterium]|nr:hypothetical protein [Myxococcales bacterium]
MRSILLLGCLLATWTMVSACGFTPETACKRGLEANCNYVHRCATADQKSSDNFIKLFGTNVADCIRIRVEGATYNTGGFNITIKPAKCEEKTEQTYCDDQSKPVFHAEFVGQCFSDYENQTCPENILTPAQPASCESICQAN